MCIGIPMQILEICGTWAICENAAGEHHKIDMMLVGDQPSGTWVLTFLNIAREIISQERAIEIQNALEALNISLHGGSIDHLFADLVNREPQLPEFLRTPIKNQQELK